MCHLAESAPPPSSPSSLPKASSPLPSSAVMHLGKMVFCKTIKRTIHICIGIILGFLVTSEFRSLNYENFKRDIIMFQLCSYQSAKPAPKSIESYFSSSSWADGQDLKRTLSVIPNLTDMHQAG